MSNHPPYRLRPEQGATLELSLPATDTLTVAAHVHVPVARAEALQPLVSQWRPRTDFSAFTAYDAGHTDGLSTKGYFGAVTDGRYVYFCPVRDHQDRYSVHGRVLRYDSQAPFHSAAAWAAYDAGHTDGLRTVGFYGGAFDGRYVYFNPRDDGHGHHTRLLRYDAHGDFGDPASWSAHDAALPHSGQGLAFDGRYLYFCPGYTTAPDADQNNPSASLDNEPSGHGVSAAVREAGLGLALAAFAPKTDEGYVESSYHGRECGFDFARLAADDIPDLPKRDPSNRIAWSFSWSSDPADALCACVVAAVACAVGGGLLLDPGESSFIEAGQALDWAREAERSWRTELPPLSSTRVAFIAEVDSIVAPALVARGFHQSGLNFERQNPDGTLNQIRLGQGGGEFVVYLDTLSDAELHRMFFTGGSVSPRPVYRKTRPLKALRTALGRVTTCLDSVIEPYFEATRSS